MRVLMVGVILGAMILGCSGKEQPSPNGNITVEQQRLPQDLRQRIQNFINEDRKPGWSIVRYGPKAGGTVTFNIQTDPSGFPPIYETVEIKAEWAEEALQLLCGACMTQ